MARQGIPHHQLRALLDLQRINGVHFNMGYKSSYTPIVLHYLAEACRQYVRDSWNRAEAKGVMTDEVKVGDKQWVTTACRMFVANEFKQMAISPTCFDGGERDATAIAQVIESSFKAHGIEAWIDEQLVSLTVDGATVLLSGLHREIKASSPDVLAFYCAAHRTQRVDYDVTSVPKKERGDEGTIQVRGLAKKLNNVLSKTAAFFSCSTKRWASLRKTASRLGYHIAHGPMSTNQEIVAKRLLKFRRLQQTRFIWWKRRAAHAWLNNLPALQQFLTQTDFPTRTMRKARQIFKWTNSLKIVGGMAVYSSWPAILSTLSMCTQAFWAVLPSLYQSVLGTLQKLENLHEALERFILQLDLDKERCKDITVRGSREVLDGLAKWTNVLKQRTIDMVNKRFDTSPGQLLWDIVVRPSNMAKGHGFQT